MYYPQTPDGEHGGYFMDTNVLYASPQMQTDPLAAAMHPRGPSPLHPAGQGMPPAVANHGYPDPRPAKRSRKTASSDGHPMGRVQGACTRCKRLKVRCALRAAIDALLTHAHR